MLSAVSVSRVSAGCLGTVLRVLPFVPLNHAVLSVLRPFRLQPSFDVGCGLLCSNGKEVKKRKNPAEERVPFPS
jgi:hypothetical protein